MMKKRKTLALLLALLLLAALPGCTGAAPEEELPKKLTALTPYESQWEGLKPWVDDFTRTHPDVEIDLEYGMDPRPSQADWDAYNTRWATELMSGEAADILLDSGLVTPVQYEQNELMYDIYEWMEADPDFHMEDYYQNLFQAFETNGHLYTLPVNFNFEVLYLNDALLQASGVKLEPWDKVDYKTILEIYENAAGQGLLADSFTLQFMDMQSKATLFWPTEMVDYVNLEDRSAAFDSPEFIEFLTATKGIPTNRKVSDGMAMVGGRAEVMMEQFATSNAEANTSLMMNFSLNLDGWIDNMDQPLEGCAGPFLLASAQGTQSFYPYMRVAVPRSCQNPELAWEFLKFMMAPTDNPAFGQRWQPEGSVDLCKTLVPINRQNFRTFAKLYSQGANYVLQTGGSAWPEDFDLTTAECPLTDELMDKLEEVFEGITKTQDRFGPLDDLLIPVLQEYYEADAMSAEQCAQRLQEIATLYLNE